MLSRLIGTGVEASERDEGICALQGHTLEGVHGSSGQIGGAKWQPLKALAGGGGNCVGHSGR
jgi:hypothetical protein